MKRLIAKNTLKHAQEEMWNFFCQSYQLPFFEYIHINHCWVSIYFGTYQLVLVVGSKADYWLVRGRYIYLVWDLNGPGMKLVSNLFENFHTRQVLSQVPTSVVPVLGKCQVWTPVYITPVGYQSDENKLRTWLPVLVESNVLGFPDQLSLGFCTVCVILGPNIMGWPTIWTSWY